MDADCDYSRLSASTPMGYLGAGIREARLCMMPTVCWEKIPSPSRFFGEIVHEEVTTEWGQKNCYLKLRAVAHLARDEGLAVGYADVSNR